MHPMATDAAPGNGLRGELEQAALSGSGWDALLARLAEASGRAVWLVAAHGGVLATSDPTLEPVAASAPASGRPASDSIEGGLEAADVGRHLLNDEPVDVVTVDGRHARAIPVRAGSRRVGLLLMEQPLDGSQEALLRAAALPVAIEAVRRDAMAEAIAESASRLIDELRFGSLRDPDQVRRSAERFGLHLHEPHAAAVFAYEGANRRTWSTAIRWIEMPVHEVDGRAWTVLIRDPAAELRRIRDRLQGIVGDDSPVLAAAGPVVDDLADTARSFAEAETTMEILRQQEGRVTLTHDELGLAALLLSVPTARLERFVETHLGPLLERPELLETLDAWFEESGSRAAVAHRLFVHRNSVGYRVGRIRELLDADPADPWTALQLRAALEARRVIAARTAHEAR
jgi:hypothetical protein